MFFLSTERGISFGKLFWKFEFSFYYFYLFLSMFNLVNASIHFVLTVVRFDYTVLLLLSSFKNTMPRRRAVGQLKGARDPISIEWEIANFESLSAEVDEFHKSPVFLFCNSFWYLQLYPNGAKSDSSEGYVGVYLMRNDSGSPVSMIYSLSLKKTEGREDILSKEKGTFVGKDNGWGRAKAIERSRLMEQRLEFLPSGTLTVICSMKCIEPFSAEELYRRIEDSIISADVSTETKKVTGTEKLSSDLQNLFISGDESDVTIIVQDEEFRLHRVILAARTPVFSSMFTHNMKEKITGVVSIDDCEADPFRAFVHYLYTGSTDQILPENVCSLYRMADKYQVNELKASCLDFMKQTLSLDSFCDVLNFAMVHGEEDLMEKAADFLSQNMVDIIGTEEWQELMKNSVAEMSELLKKALIIKEKGHLGCPHSHPQLHVYPQHQDIDHDGLLIRRLRLASLRRLHRAATGH